MISFAGNDELDIIQKYDRHISGDELKNAIEKKRVLINVENGKFIGWLRYNLFWDNTPFMNMLFILEEYRGMGHGSALVRFWETEMAKNNFTTVLTSTLSNEGAQFFYRKNGYTDCGALLLPGEALEIILMKNLSGE